MVKAVTKVGSSVVAIIFLIYTENFYIYLLTIISATVIHNLLLSYIADRNFPFLKDKAYTRIGKTELLEIFKNVYAVFIFNFGSVTLNFTDNILISMICGTVVVGYYSNYTMIISAITTAYRAIIDAIVPSVGNLNAQTDDDKQIKVLMDLNFYHFWLISFCAISLMTLLSPFVSLWTKYTGNVGYVLPEIIPILLGINFWFCWYMHIITQFKTTKGLFWYGKYVQLLEGLINLVLSAILGHFIGLTGIVLATTISMVCIGLPPYPYFLFHYGYQKSAFPFYKVCVNNFMIFIIGYLLVRLLSLWIVQVTLVSFVYQCMLCLIVTNGIICFVYRKTPQMQALRVLLTRLRK